MSETTSDTAKPIRDPRLRARKAEVARDAGRRRLDLFVLGVLVLALGITILVLAHSAAFSVRHVTVVGAHETSRAAVIAAGGLGAHPPLLDVGSSTAQRIERLPWVATARIVRRFPDSITVVLTERHPLARVTLSGGGSALLDASGRVLADLGRGAHTLGGLVAVAGLGHIPPPGATLDAPSRSVLDCAAALPASLADAVVSFELTASMGVVLRLRTGAEAEFGTAADLHEKYVALATLLAHGVLTPGVLADIRVPASPVLNP